MYPNYKVVLDMRRPKKNGLYPVKIRVTLNRVQKYYGIGMDLKPAEFERIQNGSVRKDLKLYKEKIIHWQNKTKNIIHKLDPFSFEEFNALLNEKNEPKVADVYVLFDRKIKLFNERGKVSTAKTYLDARNSLKKFKSRLTLGKVTPGFLEDYELYMLKGGKSVTTISIYVRHLRTIFNYAIDEGIIDRSKYPFGKNKYQPKAPRNVKKALTVEQIKSIIDYQVNDGSTQHLARDMWLLSYYCNGMNMKDIINLKFKNLENGTLYYERLKTSSTNKNPRPIIVSLIPEAIEIINRWKKKKRSSDDFIFPVLKKSMSEEQKLKVKNQFIKTINKYMKKIGTEIGYDKPLTTYAARHSYATILKRSGAPLGFISEALGHKSLQTTEAYLDSFEDEKRRKYAEMLVPK
jgi:integrase/recombinase XerD